MFEWLNTRRGETADGKKKQGINRRGGDPRIESNTGSASPATPAAQGAVNPQALTFYPFEIFTVGEKRYTYAKLIAEHDLNTLKVLMSTGAVVVEGHNADNDGSDCGRMPAAEEKAFIARMHKARVDEAAKSGGYAIPELKIAARNDTNVLAEIPTEALAQALRARGVNVTPEQIQEASRPQVDPEVVALMSSTGMTQEQAEQVVQAMRAVRNNPQPAAPVVPPVVPPITTPPAGGAGPGRGF